MAKKKKICFHCNSDIVIEPDMGKRVTEVRYIMVGIDVPYINLFFHAKCYSEIDSINEYLLAKAEKIYELAKSGKKVRK